MRAALLLLLAFCLSACREEMDQQRRVDSYESWPDGTAPRTPPDGVVAQDGPDEAMIAATPPVVTPALLARGRERFDIACSPCHGLAGAGDGMIVQRGFPAPPSYHTDRLRAVPARYFYDVITNGYGIMYSYAARVEPADRWAIAAYIRALQLSRHATLAEAPEAGERLR